MFTELCIGYQTITDSIQVSSHFPFVFIYQIITYLDFLSIDYTESPRADTQSYQPAFISARGLL